MNRELPASLGEDFVKYVPRTRYRSGQVTNSLSQQFSNLKTNLKKDWDVIKSAKLTPEAQARQDEAIRNPVKGALDTFMDLPKQTAQREEQAGQALHDVTGGRAPKWVGSLMLGMLDPLSPPGGKAPISAVKNALRLNKVSNIAGKALDKYDDLSIQKWVDTQKKLINTPQNEIDELRNLTWQLPGDKIMLPKEVQKRGLASTTQRMLSAKDAKIIQRKEYFDKLYEKVKSGIPLSGTDKAAFANAKKAFKDEVASPVAPLIARWVGNFGIRAYGLTGKAVKGVRQLGHKVKRNTGIDLDQHHGWKSTEGFEFGTQEALLLDSTFRVNTHQYLASKGMVPGHSAWNMWMMPNKPHLQELHPWLREMGFETYWKNIDKAVGRNNPTLFYEYIDQFFDEVFTPSLVKAEELMKKGATQYMSITPDKILLPPHVQKLMDKKKQSLLEQAMQSYTKDLKIKGAQNLPRSEINRTFQESQRRI